MSALLITFIITLFSGQSEIDSQVDAYLRKHLGPEAKYEFEVMRIPAGYSKIEIQFDKQPAIQSGVVFIPISILRSNNTIASGTISAKLKILEDVFVAVNSTQRKGVINKTDFILKSADISGLRSKPVKDLSILQRQRSKVLIKAGDILTEDMLEAVPDIQIGDKISASVTSGHVIITTDAISRQEGSTGDVIQIYTTNDNKHFKAKVIDSQNVLIIQ